MLFAASLVGCAGNVIEGLPRDGSVVAPEDDPSGVTGDGGTRDAGMVVRDATTVDPGNDRDAGNGGTPRADASTPVQPADSGAPSGNDAGGNTGTALNGGALARPNNGRKYTATLADWQGNPRCMEGTGAGQVSFCDDYESTEVGAAPGMAWTLSGTPATVSDVQKMRGTKAMRFVPASGAPSQMQQTKAVPQKMFGRVFVYFASDPPTAPSDAKWTLIEVGGTDNKAQVRLGGQIDPSRGNKNYFGIGSDGGDTGDWHTKGLEPESEVKKGAWTCLEWMFDGDANETRVWINNVEQLSLHTTAANYRPGDTETGQFVHPTYSYVKVGYWVYQSTATPTPANVFFDEFIIDDEQVGCAL